MSSLADWMQSPPALYCKAWHAVQLQKATQGVMGMFAVQLGNPFVDSLFGSTIASKIWVHNQPHCSEFVMPESCSQSVIADFTQLPFAENSVDLVVLPYTLPNNPVMSEILAEVFRVLVSHGRLVVLGYNPYSLWGIRHRCNPTYLSVGQSPVPMQQLKNSLQSLSFVIDRGRFGIYNMPFSRNMAHFERFSFLEKAGDRWWPTLGAVYMLSAIKKVHGVHAIRVSKNWKTSKKSVTAVIPAHKQDATLTSIRKPSKS